MYLGIFQGSTQTIHSRSERAETLVDLVPGLVI